MRSEISTSCPTFGFAELTFQYTARGATLTVSNGGRLNTYTRQ
jgi:hypothetical protein